MVPQHQARSEQSVSCRFQMTGNAGNKMKFSVIDVRSDESRGDRAFPLIGLVLDRRHSIDGFEKLLHMLARAAAMNILRRANGMLKCLRVFDEQIRQSKKRRGRF